MHKKPWWCIIGIQLKLCICGFSSTGLVDDEAYAIEPALDNKPYTALVYGNGPGWKSIRENLTGVDTGKFLRSQRTWEIF